MKKILFLTIVSMLMLTACTEDEVIDYVPLLSGDDEINRIAQVGDYMLCWSLSSKNEDATRRRQNRCREEVAIATLSTKACHEMRVNKEDESMYFRCVRAVARNTKNPEICEDLSGDEQAACYAEVVPLAGDASLCANIKPGRDWDNCIKNTAINTKNFSTCENLENQIKQGGCQVVVARELGDSTLCPQIIREDFQSNCYYELGVAQKDSSLCDKVSKPDRKQSCLDKAEK